MAYGSKSSLATDAASIMPKGESSTGPLKGRHTCVSVRPVIKTRERPSDGHSTRYWATACLAGFARMVVHLCPIRSDIGA